MLRALALLGLLLLAAGARAADPAYDAWGGWTGIATTATGRFRVERIDGVWWLVTPDGHGFFSAGVDHLRPDGDFAPALGTSPYQDAVHALYGTDAAWAAATVARLRGWHFNTVGAFSRESLFAGSMAYTVLLSLADAAPEVPGVPPPVVARETRDYYDPAFASGVAARVASLAVPCAADPWCLGAFTDNELALGQSLAQNLPYLDAYLLLPPGAPGKLAVQQFLTTRYAGDVAALNAAWGLSLASFDDVQQLSALSPAPAVLPASPTGTPAQQADRRAFDAEVAGRFYRVAHDAMRAAAPDVLILGSRLLVLSTRPEVVAAIAPWVDVLSVNEYEIADAILALVPSYPADYGIPFARMFDDIDTMSRIGGTPILIGEFSYRAADAGLPNTIPPFFPTLATQDDRAAATGRYLRRVLARPYMVGAHWFQYTDQPASGRFDGENQNFGLVRIDDTPWPELTARFASVNADAAPRRVLVPGGGARRLDCALEWASTAPLAVPGSPRARFVCRDGDPACDLDDVPGQCTVEVLPCAAVSDARTPGCGAVAPSAVEITARDADLQGGLTASAATIVATAAAAPGTCGPAVPVVVPLGGRAHARARFRATASTPAGVDREQVVIVCRR